MILTVIDNIPLYSTIREAVSWGRRNNIQGYHTHTHNNRLGYMAGTNHSIFVNTPPSPTSSVVTPRIPIVAQNISVNTNTTTSATPSSGGY